MLDVKQYERQELIEIFKTNRLDAIEKKLKRQGYSFTKSGRGNSYKLTITSKPNELQLFYVEELGFTPQTNVDLLNVFMRNFLTDDNFINLQFTEMKEEIAKQGYYITTQTLSKYYKQLEAKEWIFKDYFSYVYYVYDVRKGHNIYITKEEYCEMYKEYWKQYNKIYNDNSLTDKQKADRISRAKTKLKSKYGSIPKKRAYHTKCVFYSNGYNKLAELLERSFINEE